MIQLLQAGWTQIMSTAEKVWYSSILLVYDYRVRTGTYREKFSNKPPNLPLKLSISWNSLCWLWAFLFFSSLCYPELTFYIAVCSTLDIRLCCPGHICSKSGCASNGLFCSRAVCGRPRTGLFYSSCCCPWTCLLRAAPRHVCFTAACAA